MSFAPGDVVVCVNDGPCRCCGAQTSLIAGHYYRVIGYALSARGIRTIATMPAAVSWRHPVNGANPDRFRKIERADEEFSHQIRSLSPRELA